VYVGQSLDTVKVKMQAFPHLYKNAMDCFVKTYRQDGIARGLYAGTIPALAANIAENSVLFMFYGVCQKLIANVVRKHTVEHLNPLENALAGGSAAFFSSFTLCPTELIKCRLQSMREMASQGKLEGGLERLKMYVNLSHNLIDYSNLFLLFSNFIHIIVTFTSQSEQYKYI